ncbi:MAG: phosphatidylinositol-specific phospholipase C/glycerophosphodiester phosphodiesterase family protein [bacterium]
MLNDSAPHPLPFTRRHRLRFLGWVCFSPPARWRVLVLLLALPLCASGQATPLEHAHAHNDYVHARPLFGALELGFNSVEADVYLVGGQLLVAHSRDSVDAARTLETLYLAPLRTYVQQHGGRAYAGSQPLTLLIDVKSNAESTYVVLDSLLRRYADLFTISAGSLVIEGPVVAVISGERAIGAMRNARVRFAGLDGRLPDLRGAVPPSRMLMPLISDSWDQITKWKGDGPMSESERRELARVVRVAHRQGRRVRFWATPDNEAVWQVLVDAHVDLIGADDLERLRSFLLSHHTSSSSFDRTKSRCDRFPGMSTTHAACLA